MASPWPGAGALLAPPAEVGRGGFLVPDGVYDARAVGLLLPALAAAQVEVVAVEVPHAEVLLAVGPLRHARLVGQPHQAVLDGARRLDAEVVQAGLEVVDVGFAAVGA